MKTKLYSPDAAIARHFRVLGLPLGRAGVPQDPLWLSAPVSVMRAGNENLGHVPDDADLPVLTAEQRKGQGATSARELCLATDTLAICMEDDTALQTAAGTRPDDLVALTRKDADLGRVEEASTMAQSRFLQGRLLVAGAQAQCHDVLFSFLDEKTAGLRPGDPEYDKWMGVFDDPLLVRGKWLGFTRDDRQYNALAVQQQGQVLQGFQADLLLVQTLHNLRWGDEVSPADRALAGAHLADRQGVVPDAGTATAGTGAASTGKKAAGTGKKAAGTKSGGTKASGATAATPKKGNRRGQPRKA